jgi:hypothetical protein
MGGVEKANTAVVVVSWEKVKKDEVCAQTRANDEQRTNKPPRGVLAARNSAAQWQCPRLALIVARKEATRSAEAKKPTGCRSTG